MLFDKVKTLCTEKGITIYRLEKDAGCSKGSISKWNKSTPSADKLQRVASLLGVTISYLLDDANRG